MHDRTRLDGALGKIFRRIERRIGRGIGKWHAIAAKLNLLSARQVLDARDKELRRAVALMQRPAIYRRL